MRKFTSGLIHKGSIIRNDATEEFISGTDTTLNPIKPLLYIMVHHVSIRKADTNEIIVVSSLFRNCMILNL